MTLAFSANPNYIGFPVNLAIVLLALTISFFFISIVLYPMGIFLLSWSLGWLLFSCVLSFIIGLFYGLH